RRGGARGAAAVGGDGRPVMGGGGAPRFARRGNASPAGLAARAIAAAVRDARVSFADVDGVVRFDREGAWEYDLPGVMRLRALDYYGAVPNGPGSAPALVRLAAMAISQGLARIVVGYHARAGARPGDAEARRAPAPPAPPPPPPPPPPTLPPP